MIKLYDFVLSGHAHRVRLMLSLLKLEHETIGLDLVNGEHKGEQYKELSPFGLVPVLDDDGFIVRDSNAILVYLASKYGQEWLPQDPETLARIHEWLAKEASNAPGSARLVTVFGRDLDQQKMIEESHELLAIMDNQLDSHDWLAAPHATIADVSVYSYIYLAPEGGVSLDKYSNVLKWLARVEALPGFLAMPRTAAGLVA